MENLIDAQIDLALTSKRALFRSTYTLTKALELYDYFETSRYLNPLKRRRVNSTSILYKVLSGEDEEHFFNAFRMTPRQFDLIVSLIKDHTVFARRGKKPQRIVETQLKIALHRFAHDGSLSSNTALARNLGVSIGSVVRYTRRCASALCSLITTHIRWPTEEEKVQIKADFGKGVFTDIIGAVDGTLIPVFRAPELDKDYFATRKQNYAIGATAVTDGLSKFLFFHTGYIGTKHDSAAYKDTPLYTEKETFFVGDEHLVGDSAYALTPSMITAFKKLPLTPEMSKFNGALRTLRVKVEHVFGLLKDRFPSLKGGIRSNYTADDDMVWFKLHIFACVILHNILESHPDTPRIHDNPDIDLLQDNPDINLLQDNNNENVDNRSEEDGLVDSDSDSDSNSDTSSDEPCNLDHSAQEVNPNHFPDDNNGPQDLHFGNNRGGAVYLPAHSGVNAVEVIDDEEELVVAEQDAQVGRGRGRRGPPPSQPWRADHTESERARYERNQKTLGDQKRNAMRDKIAAMNLDDFHRK